MQIPHPIAQCRRDGEAGSDAGEGFEGGGDERKVFADNCNVPSCEVKGSQQRYSLSSILVQGMQILYPYP